VTGSVTDQRSDRLGAEREQCPVPRPRPGKLPSPPPPSLSWMSQATLCVEIPRWSYLIRLPRHCSTLRPPPNVDFVQGQLRYCSTKPFRRTHGIHTSLQKVILASHPVLIGPRPPSKGSDPLPLSFSPTPLPNLTMGSFSPNRPSKCAPASRV